MLWRPYLRALPTPPHSTGMCEPERAGGPFTKTRVTTNPVSWSRQKLVEGQEEAGRAMPLNKQ